MRGFLIRGFRVRMRDAVWDGAVMVIVDGG